MKIVLVLILCGEHWGGMEKKTWNLENRRERHWLDNDIYVGNIVSIWEYYPEIFINLEIVVTITLYIYISNDYTAWTFLPRYFQHTNVFPLKNIYHV